MSNIVNEGGAGFHVAASTAHQDAVVAVVNALVPAQAGLRLMGFSSKESAAIPAAATYSIKHGATAAGGVDVVYQNHALSTSMTQFFGDDGIACPNGISIGWLTGQVDIVIYYKVVT
jgi:hypothetical protein